MSRPFVSILMNCFNGEKYLEEAINSVINQSYNNWELIFWDNQSTDNSEKIVKNYKDDRIQYFKSQSHTSQYQARNKGLEKCSGELIAFLDVDDWWDKNKLDKQIKLFDDNEIGFSCTNSWIINERKLKKKYLAFKNIYSGKVLKQLFKKDFITMSSLIVRKTTIKKLDFVFNPQYEIIGDFDLVIRLSTISKLGGINEPLTYYRWHDNNLTYKKTKLNSVELLILLEELKKKEIFFNNKNFKLFKNNVLFYKAIIFIIEGKRLTAFKEILNMSKILHMIKLLVSLCLPAKLIIKIRSQ